jgi:hypothetical protein
MPSSPARLVRHTPAFGPSMACLDGMLDAVTLAWPGYVPWSVARGAP